MFSWTEIFTGKDKSVKTAKLYLAKLSSYTVDDYQITWERKWEPHPMLEVDSKRVNFMTGNFELECSARK